MAIPPCPGPNAPGTLGPTAEIAMLARLARNVRLNALLGAALIAAGCATGYVENDADATYEATATERAGGPITGFFESTKISYRNQTPLCDDPLVLRRIARRVPAEVRNTLHRDISVVRFEHPVQTGFQDRTYDVDYQRVHTEVGSVRKGTVVGREQLGQRFCRVRALFSDHHERNVYYVTETPMGFAGSGHNMTFCVAGLDPWYVHGHHCSSLRSQ